MRLQVTWGRIGSTPLDKTRHSEGQEGAKYILTIDPVHDSDLGQYTCTAKSNLGTAVATIELTGQRSVEERRTNRVSLCQLQGAEGMDGLGATWRVPLGNGGCRRGGVIQRK